MIDAVLGGSEQDSLEHLSARSEHCARLVPAESRRYLEALRAALPRSPSWEGREAALLIELGQQANQPDPDLDPVPELLEIAEQREREGRQQRASAWLTLGWQILGQDPRLEAALGQFRERALARTHAATEHLARADEAARAGRLGRAERELERLRSVEPSHPHAERVAQTIAGQRRGRRTARQRLLARTAAGTLALGLGLCVFLWERSARAAYQGLEVVLAGEPQTVERRLLELESFMLAYPLWGGCLAAIEERARLKVALTAERRRIEEAPRPEPERFAEDQQRAAEQLYFEGRRLAEALRFAEAQAQFEQALGLAPTDWPRRERVTRDIAALTALEGELPQ
jgi:tetratricopeptide (TPR) repeat protein